MNPPAPEVPPIIKTLRAPARLPTRAVNGLPADRIELGVNPEPASQSPNEPQAAPSEPEVPHRFVGCLDHMRMHLRQPIRVSTLSAMVGLSESRFYELFRRATGHTPLNWFIRTRMQWAARLLERTSLPVKSIADQVGYEDPFYFSRVFKSVYGISPSGYRAQKQEQPARLLAA